jgi:flagellar biosynthesis/type III secretory pathway chaperone
LARSPDVAALPANGESKADLYGGLSAIGKARGSWLHAQQLPDLSAALDADPALHARWAEIVDLARTARRVNDTNGRLVRTRKTYNKAALDAIRVAHGSPPAVYGADGRMA